jgi:hypothetical protein
MTACKKKYYLNEKKVYLLFFFDFFNILKFFHADIQVLIYQYVTPYTSKITIEKVLTTQNWKM